MPILKLEDKDVDVVQYADCTALSRALRAMDPETLHDNDPKGSFYGGSLDDALRLADAGAPDLVAASDAMMKRIEDLVGVDTSARRSMPAVTGGAPVVPAYLAGQPMAMRQRRTFRDASNPIAVIVNAGASAGVKPRTIQRRGAAVLALTRLLSASRPVQLYMMAGHSDNGAHALTLVRIETEPLDVARAAFCMAHPAFLRRLMFSRNGTVVGRDSVFPPLFKNSLGRPNLAAQVLGVSEYIASDRLTDDDEFGSDEVAAAWVAAHVKAHAQAA